MPFQRAPEHIFGYSKIRLGADFELAQNDPFVDAPILASRIIIYLAQTAIGQHTEVGKKLKQGERLKLMFSLSDCLIKRFELLQKAITDVKELLPRIAAQRLAKMPPER